MASGDTLFGLLPNNYSPAAGSPALYPRNGHFVLAFDADTAESALFPGVMPRNYAGGGITVLLVVSFATSVNTAHAARFGVSFERMNDNGLDVDADSFATEKTLDLAPRATSGLLTYGTVAFTNGAEIDGLLVGERFRLKVRRIATDAADTALLDCELHGVELKET